MKKKIIIIGKKSFIGKNLYNFFKKNFNVLIVNYKQFFNLPLKSTIDTHYIVNCSINKKYIKNKYSESCDFDLQIAKRIKKNKCKMVFLSTRKVYKVKDNIKEDSVLSPICNYSKNKIITEKKLLNLIKERVLILRISNLIGLNYYSYSKKKIHQTFNASFFINIKKNIIFDNKKLYKDFLSIKLYCLNKWTPIIPILKSSHMSENNLKLICL